MSAAGIWSQFWICQGQQRFKRRVIPQEQSACFVEDPRHVRISEMCPQNSTSEFLETTGWFLISFWILLEWGGVILIPSALAFIYPGSTAGHQSISHRVVEVYHLGDFMGKAGSIENYSLDKHLGRWKTEHAKPHFHFHFWAPGGF